MKITTYEVLQWDKELDDYVLVYEESYEYDGPVAQMQGSTTSTTTSSFPGNFQGNLDRLNQAARGLFEARSKTPRPFFPGNILAGFDPAQQEAQQRQLGVARNVIPGQLEGIQGASADLLRAPDPANDPTVRRFANAAVNPLLRQFQNQILPGIRSGAQAAGAFGGTRQGQLENQATGDLFSRAGDVRAGIFNNAFNEQLRARQHALTLAPQTLGLANRSSELISQVGDVRQGQRQAEIQADREKFEFFQNRRSQDISEFGNILGVTEPPRNTTTTTSAPSRRTLEGALGGAVAGLGLGSEFDLGGAGAILGGLAGLVGLI